MIATAARKHALWGGIALALVVAPLTVGQVPWLKAYPESLVLPFTPLLNQFMTWFVEGTGQFRPGAGASPAIGTVGELERMPEHRVEVTFPKGLRDDVVAALRTAHPYEEPAFHVIETAPVDPA